METKVDRRQDRQTLPVSSLCGSTVDRCRHISRTWTLNKSARPEHVTSAPQAQGLRVYRRRVCRRPRKSCCRRTQQRVLCARQSDWRMQENSKEERRGHANSCAAIETISGWTRTSSSSRCVIQVHARLDRRYSPSFEDRFLRLGLVQSELMSFKFTIKCASRRWLPGFLLHSRQSFDLPRPRSQSQTSTSPSHDDFCLQSGSPCLFQAGERLAIFLRMSPFVRLSQGYNRHFALRQQLSHPRRGFCE